MLMLFKMNWKWGLGQIKIKFMLITYELIDYCSELNYFLLCFKFLIRLNLNNYDIAIAILTLVISLISKILINYFIVKNTFLVSVRPKTLRAFQKL